MHMVILLPATYRLIAFDKDIQCVPQKIAWYKDYQKVIANQSCELVTPSQCHHKRHNKAIGPGHSKQFSDPCFEIAK